MKKKKNFLSIISILLTITFITAGCGTDSDGQIEPSESVTYSETTTEETESVSSSSTELSLSTTTTTSQTEQSVVSERITSATSSTTKQVTSVRTNRFTKKTSTSAEIQKISEQTYSTTEITKSTARSTTKAATKTTKAAENSFFDDAVFVGDSVTLGLRNYVTSERNKGNSCLGKAQFLTAGSMGYTNTVLPIGNSEAIHPKYQGKETMIEDGVKKIGAKKVFIMLGMNDFCAFSLDTGMANAKKCIKRITDKNPGVKIYVESVTPTLNNKGRFNNTNINSFNNGLKNLCSENSWTYVDVASVMKDSNGLLKSAYCSDPEGRGVHMTYAGCASWVNYLTKKFA